MEVDSENLTMNKLAKRIIIGVIAGVLLVVIVVGIFVGAAFFGWRAAIRSGNEAAAMQDIKTIAAVQVQYYNTHDRRFGTFDQLVKEGFDARFAGEIPNVDGYVFILQITPRTPAQPSSYMLNVDPQSNSTGNRHFYLDSTDNLVRVNPDHPAGPTDPSVVQ